MCYRRGIPSSLLEKIDPHSGMPTEQDAEQEAHLRRLRAQAWQEKNDRDAKRAAAAETLAAQLQEQAESLSSTVAANQEEVAARANRLALAAQEQLEVAQE